ncbi:MAG: hypothetical protein BWY91_02941 [bacterium ADurb.BinA028]|nr:MAG: hypothetical protein BWY91_02941 [bacterium ADurb.BinA028]
MIEGDPLVERPAAQPADPDGREDEVSAFEGLVDAGSRADGHWPRRAGSLLSEHPGHRLEAPLVDVVQDEFVHPPGVFVVQQRPVHQGDPESTAAEEDEPHAKRTSVPWARQAFSVAGSAPWVVTRTSI